MKSEHIDVYMREALEAATTSPDPSSQNGAVVVVEFADGSHEMIGMGWNDFPEGVTPRLENREEKYAYIEHAEKNALWDTMKAFMRNPMSVPEDAKLYLISPWVGCADCSKAIVGAGINTVIRFNEQESNTRTNWHKSISDGDNILIEGGVTIIDLEQEEGKFGVDLLRSGEIRHF